MALSTCSDSNGSTSPSPSDSAPTTASNNSATANDDLAELILGEGDEIAGCEAVDFNLRALATRSDCESAVEGATPESCAPLAMDDLRCRIGPSCARTSNAISQFDKQTGKGTIFIKLSTNGEPIADPDQYAHVTRKNETSLGTTETMYGVERVADAERQLAEQSDEASASTVTVEGTSLASQPITNTNMVGESYQIVNAVLGYKNVTVVGTAPVSMDMVEEFALRQLEKLTND